jgi:hypothetical protein
MAPRLDVSLENVAETLLADVKDLGSSVEGDAQRRDRIVQATKRIISEVADPIDQMKAQWGVVRLKATPNAFREEIITDRISWVTLQLGTSSFTGRLSIASHYRVASRTKTSPTSWRLMKG